MKKRRILVLALSLAASAPALGQSLAVNEVFIKNDNAWGIADFPVAVPIAFAEGAMTPGQLPQLRVGNLATQAVATSYYKGGSVRTAVAWVLASLPAATESIHTLGQGSSPAFVWGAHVQDLLKNQNGKSLRVVAKDVKGGEYAVTLDIDGMGNCNAQNQNPAKFSANCVLALEDGPVRKVWEIRKRHDPVPGGTAEDLPYLFTSVFIVSAYSKADFVTVEHFLTNSNNLDEDPAPALSGGPNNGWKYANPQHGAIFYTDARIEVQSPAGADHHLYYPDAAILQPSLIDPASTPQSSRYWIMPANGESLLAGSPYNTGVGLANPSNYMAGGQSLLTRLVVSFSGALSAHPIEESGVSSGGPLKMYNQVDDMFFRELIDPQKLNPNVSYQADATTQFNAQKNLASQANRVGRWGQGVYYSKDTGSGGFADGYHQESLLATRFLLSCQQRCAADYLRAMRFENYPSSEMTNHFVGFRGDEHPKANIEFYRSSAFEGEANGAISCSGGPYNPKDALGFCQNNMMPPGHRTDAAGRSVDLYVADPGRTMPHDWAMREPSHLSAAYSYYRYLFLDDHAARYIMVNTVESVISTYFYFGNGQNSVSGTPHQDRALGRSMIWASRLYAVTRRPHFKNTALMMLTMAENQRNKQADGARGINPATGDFYPTKFYARSLMTLAGHSSCPGSAYRTIKPFHDAQIAHGLSAVYRDLLDPATDSGPMSGIANMMKDHLHYTYTYAYKSPFQVRNKTPNLSDPGKNINEGKGGFSDYYCLYVDNNGDTPSGPYANYNTYSADYQTQIFPGYCNELLTAGEIRKSDPSYLMSGQTDLLAQYVSKLKDAAQRAFIHPSYKGYGSGGSLTIWGNDPKRIDDETVCMLALGAEIPNALGGGYVNGFYQATAPVFCPDNDNDGWTTCNGDCNDSDGNIHPGRAEVCGSANVDYNCNGLIGCADEGCGGSSWYNNQWNLNNPGSGCFLNGSPKAGYCGNNLIEGLESCEVYTGGFPGGSGGGGNNCGAIANNSPPVSAGAAAAPGYCLPAFTSLVNGCSCASNSLFLSGISAQPAPVIVGQGPYALTIQGNGIQAGDLLRITKQGSSPAVNVDLTIGAGLTATLSAAQVNTLGAANHAAKVIASGSPSNSVSFPITAPPAPIIHQISPDRIAYNIDSPPITLTGSGFTPASEVLIDGASANSLLIADPGLSGDQLTFQLSLAQTLTLGVGNHTVAVKDGVSLSTAATLRILAPILNAIEPASIINGAPAVIDLTVSFPGSAPRALIGSLPPIALTANAPMPQSISLSSAQVAALGVGDHPVRIDNGGALSNSLTLSVASAGVPPSAPSNLSATTLPQAQIRLTWSDNSPNETGFVLERSVAGSSSGFTPIAANLPADATVFVDSNGLSPNATHYYRLQAVNASGASAWSNVTAAFNDTRAPTTPLQHQGGATAATSLLLSWSRSLDNVGVSGYSVTVALDSNFSSIVPGWSNRNVGNQLSATVGGLSPATAYYSRVRAFDAAQNVSPYSPTASATTLSNGTPPGPGVPSDTSPPSRPGNLSLTPSPFDIVAAWEASTDDRGVTGYRLRVTYDAQGLIPTWYDNFDLGDVLRANIRGLEPGKTYHVSVYAYDAAGNLSPAASLLATTLAAPAGTDFAVVTPAQGGWLIQADGARVDVPPGSYPTPWTLTARRASDFAGPRTRLLGQPFEFGPHDLVFEKPVALSLPQPGSSAGLQVKVSRYDPASMDWQGLDSRSAAGLSGYWSADVTHFSIFGLTLTPQSAGAVSQFYVKPNPAKGGAVAKARVWLNGEPRGGVEFVVFNLAGERVALITDPTALPFDGGYGFEAALPAGLRSGVYVVAVRAPGDGDLSIKARTKVIVVK